MSHYDDEAQVEALRKWWHENWKALLAGLVLGLGAIFGWEQWQNHQVRVAGDASRMLEELNQAAAAGQTDRATELANQLRDRHGSSPYADQGQLALAKHFVDKSGYEAAHERLVWVVANSADDGTRHIARLRQARVLWQMDKLSEALSLLEGREDAGSFAALYEELRGDIKFAQGDRPAARAAYQKALELGAADASQDLLKRKLDDLADLPTQGAS